jgi:hypothetical protein
LNSWEELSILSKQILCCEGTSCTDGFTWEVTRSNTKELGTIIISVIAVLVIATAVADEGLLL